VSKRGRRARARLQKGARLRSRAHLLVAAAVLAGLLASFFAMSARAASPRPASTPALLSTFLPARALSSEAPGRASGAEGAAPFDAAHVSPKPGGGGWYWPTGTEDFGGYAGFLEPRGAYVHVAQDMRSAKGRPVYAIGAGTVWIARADAGGYGVDGAPGGCLIIVHRTAAGEDFRALYGHLSGLQYKAGAQVAAGAVIATVNGCDHLHFSIHPSDVYRDRNPYAGHVPKSWKDHGGFVDPVEYLKANPRAATYVPPVLPVVRIATDLAPSGFGAAGGIAFWDEQTDAGAVTYAYDLLAGTRRQLAPDETVPPFDEVRYAVQALIAPALGISVSDRQPVLTPAARGVTPAWGAAASLTATLTNATAQPFQGARIALERLTGADWKQVAAGLTNGKGRVAFAYAPAQRTVLRLRFLLPLTQPEQATYVPAESPAVTVAPKVLLSVPALPGTVARGSVVTVTGSLTPRHAPGKGSVRLELQRLTLAGGWVTALTADVLLGDGAAGSLYSHGVKLGNAGAWRVRAVHPGDAAHAVTVSGWREFVVE